MKATQATPPGVCECFCSLDAKNGLEQSAIACRTLIFNRRRASDRHGRVNEFGQSIPQTVVDISGGDQTTNLPEPFFVTRPCRAQRTVGQVVPFKMILKCARWDNPAFRHRKTGCGKRSQVPRLPADVRAGVCMGGVYRNQILFHWVERSRPSAPVSASMMGNASCVLQVARKQTGVRANRHARPWG